jgi:hypothetical protein
LVPDADLQTSILYWRSIEASTSASTGELRYVLLQEVDGTVKALCAFQYVLFNVEQVLEKISRFKFIAKNIVGLLIRPHHRLLVGGSVWI